MIRKQIGICILVLLILGTGALITPVFGTTTDKRGDAIYGEKPEYENHTYQIVIRFASSTEIYGGCTILQLGTNMIKIRYNGSIIYIPIYSIVKITEEN